MTTDERAALIHAGACAMAAAHYTSLLHTRNNPETEPFCGPDFYAIMLDDCIEVSTDLLVKAEALVAGSE